MNRKIKFRGKSKKTRKWLYGYLGEAKFSILDYVYTDKVIFDNVLSFNTDNSAYVVKDLSVEEDTIGQFTGLFDKNGTDIYEGDILRVKEYKNEAIPIFKYNDIQHLSIDDVRGAKTKEWIGEVKFEESVFFINDTYLSAFHGDIRLSFPIYEIEVIGNIYDNPELIEQSL